MVDTVFDVILGKLRQKDTTVGPGGESLWTQSLLNDDIYRETGNVGIGTDDATTELEVVGHITSKGTKWKTQSTPVDKEWLSVTYGDGLFVAVAVTGIDPGNRVMTSPDGVVWTSQVSAEDNEWMGVIYGNGLFVAVASTDIVTDERVMTSPDGINWSAQISASNVSWQGVTYGNGLFVAVASSGANRVMTSPDGITWTSRSAAEDNNWRSITYGNGLFIAVANSGTLNRAMVSPDGINWTIGVTPVDNNWRSIVYGNGIFVAVSNDGTLDQIMTSLDGINWVIRVTPKDNNWRGLTYGNGLFVVVAGSGTLDRVMTSPDGITWTTRVNSVDNSWRSIVYGNGIFVAVSNDGTLNRVMTSGKTEINITPSNNILQGGLTINQQLKITGGFPDINKVLTSDADGLATWEDASLLSAGKQWTIQTGVVDNAWHSVTYGNGLFVAVAFNGTLLDDRIMTSPDGINWTTQVGGDTDEWTNITYGNGLFVSINRNSLSQQVITSPDGTNWTRQNTPVSNDWTGITYGNGLFVAVATDAIGDNVMTSLDGITWTDVAAPQNNNWIDVTYGNGIFVSVATNGHPNQAMTSSDGINWTIQTTPVLNFWFSVTYGNGLFVAISNSVVNNQIMTSPDGINWTLRSAAEQNIWRSITYGNGIFVVVSAAGLNNQVMTSPDGINWTIQVTPEQNNWRRITYGNGLFVVVATGGVFSRVMTSGKTEANITPSNNIYQGGLTVNQQIKITGGGPGANKVLTSDVDGLATWEDYTFVTLTDTPISYNGVAGKKVTVNLAEDGVEYTDADMSLLKTYKGTIASGVDVGDIETAGSTEGDFWVATAVIPLGPLGTMQIDDYFHIKVTLAPGTPITSINAGIFIKEGAPKAIPINNMLDEDDMTSDSDIAVPTQQSVKSYVDAQINTGGSLWTELSPGGDIYRETGNVGMGTAAPSKILEIVGLGATGMEYLFNDTGASLDGYQKLNVATAGFTIVGKSRAAAVPTDVASISLFQETTGIKKGMIIFKVNDGANLVERMHLTSDGDLGIGGTPAVGTKLYVNGSIFITGGNPGVGKVLTSDAGGLATWESLASSQSSMMLVGTTNTAAGADTLAPHGLSLSDITGFTVMLEVATNEFVGPNDPVNGRAFGAFIDSTNVVITQDPGGPGVHEYRITIFHMI